MDLHAAQLQGFDIPVDHLYANPVLDGYFLSLGLNQDDFVVVSPDEGASNAFSSMWLVWKLAIVDKRRIGSTRSRPT